MRIENQSVDEINSRILAKIWDVKVLLKYVC